jgi:hypothetical protein
LHCLVVQIICFSFPHTHYQLRKSHKEVGQKMIQPMENCFFNSYGFFEPRFLWESPESALRLLWAGKERHKCRLVLSCFLACNDFYGRTHSVWPQKAPQNFRIFCARTKGAWIQSATRVIFTTQISFFCAGKGGYFEPFGFRRSSNRQ